MRIGVLGSGTVGQVLADGLLAKGHEVMRGSREPAKLEAWRAAAGPRARVGRFAEAAGHGEVVVLAVKGSAAVAAVVSCGEALAGKTVIDTTNPIADAPPVNGVLQFFTGPGDSLLERLQAAVPSARFVKAFSCVGSALMVDPKLPGGPPTMFICGNHEEAKGQVGPLLVQLGWEVEDLGAAEAARAIEPLCMLWCIPGFRQNRWRHAFKLLKG
jgi:predicted dinucleotide-binding enzyme